jgi:hypothetical protein
VKWHIIVKAVSCELLDPFRMLGCKINPELDDDAALRRINDDRVRRIGAY